MRSVLIGAMLVCALSGVVRAASHRLRVYPNASIKIFAITEGPEGLLWLATADGLYRFDGFHYQKIGGYPFASARFVTVTRDGSIWSGDYEGLARRRNGKFEIVLRGGVNHLAADGDQLFIRLQEQDLVRVRLDGSVQHLQHLTRRDLNMDVSGRVWATCVKPGRGCWIDSKHPEQLNSFPLASQYQTVARDANGKIWAADDEQADLIEDGRPVATFRREPTRETSRAGPLLPGRNGQLWFLGETIHGLSSKIEFSDHVDKTLFSPLSGFEDRNGHLWVALVGKGLQEWIPDSQWHRWFSRDLADEPTVQVVKDRLGSTILSTHKSLYRLSTETGKWTRLIKEDRRYDGLLALEDGGFLAAIRNVGVVRLSPDGRIVERLKDLVPSLNEYREIVRDRKGRIWIGGRRVLLRVEGQAGSMHFREEYLPEVQTGTNDDAVDLELDSSGRLWVGYALGIAWLDDDDKWHKLTTDQPVTMVRSFTLAGDDIWVAHRRSGAFSRLQRAGEKWRVSIFSTSGGYAPSNTDFLKRDSRGWIWRGTSAGVYVSDGRHFAPADWLHLDMGNGLASDDNNQYGFFEDTDGSVWIAGEDGVSHFRPDVAWFDAPRNVTAPLLTNIEADGRMFAPAGLSSQTLPPDTRVLRIHAGTLHASRFRDYPLRYRLRPLFADWRLSRTGTLEFANLPNNLYTLELGYTGNGPSKVAEYSLQIGVVAPRLSRLWLIALAVAVIGLISIMLFLPWLERPRFRFQKALFLLRRRYVDRNRAGSADDYSGEILRGRYHVKRILSQGGFSVVYEARDVLNGEALLALKILIRSAGHEGQVRDRFAHEVAALRSTQHPGIVQILDSWVSAAGEPCLVMPFLEGQTLRAALEKAPLSIRRVARIVSQLGAALGEVHGRGIVHRDLKPENLMVVSPGTDMEQAVIIDFGTAGLRSAENELAGTTLMAGSFHYMAPERLTGRYSPASDVFSLAVIILEMITLKRLSDLNSTFSDAEFEAELENALGASLSTASAMAVARSLAPAFDPEPRHRPASVTQWTEEIVADLVDTSVAAG